MALKFVKNQELQKRIIELKKILKADLYFELDHKIIKESLCFNEFYNFSDTINVVNITREDGDYLILADICIDDEIKSMMNKKSLYSLSINNCTNLKEINNSYAHKLNISNCNDLISINNMSVLNTLSIRCCINFKKISNMNMLYTLVIESECIYSKPYNRKCIQKNIGKLICIGNLRKLKKIETDEMVEDIYNLKELECIKIRTINKKCNKKINNQLTKLIKINQKVNINFEKRINVYDIMAGMAGMGGMALY